MDIVELPEADEAEAAAAGWSGSQELGQDQRLEPGRRVEGNSETAAAAAAVVGQAEGLQAENCIQQDTACHIAAVVVHLAAAEEGIHLEPGTADTPDHQLQRGVPVVPQHKGAVVEGALLAEALQKRRKQCCQESLSAPLLQQQGEQLGPGPRSGQKQI